MSQPIAAAGMTDRNGVKQEGEMQYTVMSHGLSPVVMRASTDGVSQGPLGDLLSPRISAQQRSQDHQIQEDFPEDMLSPRSPGPGDGNIMRKLDHSEGFGEKGISMAAGIILLINNITGPGVPGLANLFAEAGWLPPMVCILLCWAITTLSSSMYAEAMANIPGNENFQGRIEFSTIIEYYFGRSWFIAAMIGLVGSLMALVIISVVQSVQVMDNLLSTIFGHTCGMNITPFQNVWTNATGAAFDVAASTEFFACIDTNDIAVGNPWGCHIVLTLGFIVVASMAIPCGVYNLDDNMIIQQIAFWLTMSCWGIWVIASFTNDRSMNDISGGIMAINTNAETGSIAGVLGAILFNFGFVTTVPSWINEKDPSVKVNRSLWTATTICVGIYFIVGIPAAHVFADVLQGTVTGTCPKQVLDPSYNCANNLLQIFTQSTTAPWQSSSFGSDILKLSVYMFPVVCLVSSIPIFCIIIKYNLQENGFSKGASFFWGVVFPWVASFPLVYQPNVLAQVINFTSLLFVSFTSFIVPFMLYIKLQTNQQKNAEDRVNMDNIDGSALLSPALAATPSHNAFPSGYGRENVAFKVGLSRGLGLLIAVAAVIATVLTFQQGQYSLDAQTCALTGQ